MAHQLMPSSGQDEGSPRLWTAEGSARTGRPDVDLYLHSDLGLRAGESNPGRMLAWVLLIVAAVVVAGVVTLVLWLV